MTEKHDRLRARALALLEGEILVEGGSLPEKPSFFVRRRLQTAVALLEEALAMKPEDAAALYGAAKAHQRLGNLPAALDLLEQAQRGDPSNAGYARDAALVARQLGARGIEDPPA